MEMNDEFAVWYARSDESAEMNDEFAVAYDWSDESVERNDEFEALYDWSDESVEKDKVFAVLGVSGCGSIWSVFAGLDVPSGRSAKRSKMLSSFTSLDDSLGKSVRRYIAPFAVLEDSSGEYVEKNDAHAVLDDSSLDSSDESVEEDNSDRDASDSSIR